MERFFANMWYCMCVWSRVWSSESAVRGFQVIWLVEVSFVSHWFKIHKPLGKKNVQDILNRSSFRTFMFYKMINY